MEIVAPTNCGNSPKSALLRDFNAAAARGDWEFVGGCLADDATWLLYEPAGQKRIEGRDAILDEYRRNLVIAPKRFVIETIVTHGRSAAANGSIAADDGRNYVWCDVYRFASLGRNAKIKQMTSYIIEAMGTAVGGDAGK